MWPVMRTVLVLAFCFLSGCSGCESRLETSAEKAPPRQRAQADPTVTAPPAAEPVAETSEDERVAVAEEEPSPPGANDAPMPTGDAPGASAAEGGQPGSQANAGDNGDPAPAGPTPDSPPTPSGSAGGKAGDGKTPQAALRDAQRLWRQSQAESKEGRHGKAFQSAAEAWAAVQQFPQDATCKSLAEEIAARLDDLGDRANRAAGSPDTTTKPLILR